MAKKLYIGNLPYSMTGDELKSLFSQAGEVSEATIITDKFSGRSRGFGFVTMTDDAAADGAVAQMNGKDIEGRALVVNEARPLADRPPRRTGGGGGYRNDN